MPDPPAETRPFDSPAALARHLFDQAVTASMTGHDRIRLALVAQVAARNLYTQHQPTSADGASQ